MAAINLAAPKPRWIGRLNDAGRAVAASADELSASLGHTLVQERRSLRAV